MSRRSSSEWGSLADRSQSPAPESASNSSLAKEDDPTHLPALERAVDPCHVWVDGQHAGVLMAWKRYPHSASAGWLGQVMWCPPDIHDAAIDWLPAVRITPAHTG